MNQRVLVCEDDRAIRLLPGKVLAQRGSSVRKPFDLASFDPTIQQVLFRSSLGGRNGRTQAEGEL
jgi:hypothetical protein